MATQLVTPNLDPYIKEGGVILNDWLGWCLAYAKTAFKAFGNTGGTAWLAWQNTQLKHPETEALPIGVYVPIWFSGYGGMGHVAILFKRADGQIQIWSSPISHKPYADTWNSIAAVEKAYGVDYVGWSEDIAGVRVIDATPTLLPNQRIVGAAGVHYREQPNTSAKIIKDFESGDILNFKGYVKGQTVSGNNIWFVGAITGYYCWSGSMTDSSTTGLSDITPGVPVTPPTAPTPPPVPAYSFTKDVPCVTEVIPLDPSNFEYGNFPDKPLKAVIHDFGAEGINTYTSVINTFTKNSGRIAGSHFVISGKHITQMASLKDRAYHAGAAGNDFVGIETDPAQDADTIASTRLLLTQLKDKYGYQLELIEHNQLAPTACGDDVELTNYDITPVVTPPVEPPVVPPSLDQENNNLLKQILAIVTEILNKIKSVFK